VNYKAQLSREGKLGISFSMTKKIFSSNFLLLISFIFLLGFHQKELKVKDDRGKWIVLSNSPRRIISLAPNLTEILFLLELDSKVVAVSNMCDYPPEALLKSKVGSFNPSIERIISLKPDLILATTAGNRMETIRRLETLGQSVFVTSPDTFNKVLKSIVSIGRITDKEKLAVLKAEQLKKRMELISSQVRELPRPRVLYVIWNQPLMTTGGNTFLSNLIRLAGGRSISEDIKQNIALLSREEIIRRDPEVIFLPAFQEEKILKEFLQQWEILTAVKKGSVYQLNEDLILRPGPRIVDGLELMVRTLHPEAFVEK